MRKTTFVLLILALASALLIAQAQNPPAPPDPAKMVQHRVNYLTTVLNLNATQQQQATTIFTNAETSPSGIHGSMRAAHQALQTAVKNNDTNGISQAANTIGNLTAQVVAAHATASAAFYQILTPDQQAKMTQLEKNGPGPHAMGMGPMMGMGDAMFVTAGPN
jgi:Spy/CpxP family protein refolding chaperone